MIVKLAHAVSDENRRSSGGIQGDQTGKEVTVWDWYDKPWTTVIRAKSKRKREKIAETAEKIAANNNIGYNQLLRTSMSLLAERYKYDIDKIVTPCSTDCSAMVSVCVNAAGIKVSRDMYTGNERSLLDKAGKFDFYTDKLHTRKCLYLRRGDILLGAGHTAVVISNGSDIRKELAIGCVGEEVRELQEALNDMGFSCGAVDGDFGQKTRFALELFQTAVGIKADSVAGKKTVAQLGLLWNR